MAAREFWLKGNDLRLAFPDLWEATQVQGQGSFAYRCTILVPKGSDNAKMVDKHIREMAAEEWKTKADRILDEILPDKKACCWVDGDRRDYSGYEDNYALSVIRYREKGRPTIVDRDRSPLTEKDGKPYAGCYVNAKVQLWTQDNKHGKGIRCELLGIQFVLDGDAFAGGAKAADADEFEDLSAGADADAMC
ncbi:ssDNA-binding protein [Aquabacterium sp.]|uniref:ssDNA-binding protein n=1 Tax=Aquabacterium sp. TaxID=1872578 RepID=UPI0040383337